MNRNELQSLAQTRILDAEALLNAGRWSGVYYLAGYAVECALKACIAKLTREYDFPDAKLVQKSFTHDNEILLRLSGLASDRDRDLTGNRAFEVNWQFLSGWNESARYREWTEAQARDLYFAVNDPFNGILPWIIRRW